jgi:MFS family permease
MMRPPVLQGWPNPVLTGALLAMMLAALDSSIVNTALPRMVADLGGLTHLSWVVTAFMLSSTITTPLYGKLSDTHGRRSIFAVSIGIFLLALQLHFIARSESMCNHGSGSDKWRRIC